MECTRSLHSLNHTLPRALTPFFLPCVMPRTQQLKSSLLMSSELLNTLSFKPGVLQNIAQLWNVP